MRVEWVTAVAFGPFRDARLEFSPQLTVIYGPNEAGKSSWHAAIYAALCGVRRGPGRRGEDRDFADSRRPWDGTDWQVRAVICLDSGRRVELHQNLSDLAHCSATDADLGRDVSNEILNEGTPDGAKWLGLDRTSFLSVACVGQADIQAVINKADSLQDELQKAAASVAKDATAAQAIEAIVQFHRENVGLDRSNSTKPLTQAKVGAKTADAALRHAREKHAEWLILEGKAIALRASAHDVTRQLAIVNAQRALIEAEAWRGRLNTARTLAGKYPSSPAPLPDENMLSDDIAAALSEWGQRPEVPIVDGPTTDSIRAEIEALPAMPVGETTISVDVSAARAAYERAAHALELHVSQQLSEFAEPDTKGLTAHQLRELAEALETAIPAVDPALESQYAETINRVQRGARSASTRVVIVSLATAAVLAGLALWASSSLAVLGFGLIGLGMVLFVWLVFRTGDAQRMRDLEEMAAIEAQLNAQRQAKEDARSRVRQARQQVASRGLQPVPATLRDLADQVILATDRRNASAAWHARHAALESDVKATSEVLRQHLRDRGLADTADLTLAYRTYESECQSRAAQATRAGRQQDLEDQLRAQEAAELAAQRAQDRRTNAERALLETAVRCGTETRNPSEAVAALKAWQMLRTERIAKFDAAAREYAQLQSLLGDGTVQDLEHQTAERERRAAGLVEQVGHVPAPDRDADLEAEAERLDKAAREAERDATDAEAQMRERALGLPSVAEAEESDCTARQELERVTVLDRTLTRALEYLRNAEQRVHRDIAPTLAAGLRQWLSIVTQGRYTDARVDPSTLNVQVLGLDHEWRDAQQLSHGTAEQIYLLLRFVLADRLTTTGETCPLLLDDVLVQSDRARKRALLDVISAVSRTRQVILLTQEEDVLEWAREKITASDFLIELQNPSTAPVTIGHS